MTGTLLTTRNTRADEEEALGLELLGAADGVGVVGVTTVDDDVTGLKEGNELLDEVVDGRAGLDEEDDLAGSLELCDKLLEGVGALDVGACDLGMKSEGVRARTGTRWGLPLASFARKWSTLLVVRLYATTVKPLSFMLRMRFWP